LGRKLEIVGGSAGRQVVSLEPGRKIVLGRAPQCDVQIVDDELSRRHCEVENRGGMLVLTDLASSNGSFVNGRRTDTFPIGPGDEVRIGKISLHLVDEAPAPSTPSAKPFAAPGAVSDPPPYPAPKPLALTPAYPAAKVVSDDSPFGSAPAFPSKPAQPRPGLPPTPEPARAGSPAPAPGAPRDAGTPAPGRLVRRYDPTASFDRLAPAGQSHDKDGGANKLLRALHSITTMMNSAVSQERLFEVVIDAIVESCSAERGALLIRDRHTGAVEPAVIRKGAGAADDTPLSVSRTVVDEAVGQGLSVLTSDAGADARFASGQSILAQKIKSVMCVPLRAEQEILGAVYVDSTSLVDAFAERDLETLSALGHQAGLAIQRARLVEDLASMFVGAIRLILASIEARDSYTYGHAERVTSFGLAIGETMGLSHEEMEGLWLAGLLHDVGKIGVPDQVLHKSGALSPEEREEIRRHPVIGDWIVAHIPEIRDRVRGGIRHHHERWDGRGYPDGLRAELVPLFARILAVADTYDAMTSDRPYRRGLGADKAVQAILEGAGGQFDPKVVEAFTTCYRSGRFTEAQNVFGRHYGLRGADAAKPAA